MKKPIKAITYMVNPDDGEMLFNKIKWDQAVKVMTYDPDNLSMPMFDSVYYWSGDKGHSCYDLYICQ